jgi:hypothetical protein
MLFSVIQDKIEDKLVLFAFCSLSWLYIYMNVKLR